MIWLDTIDMVNLHQGPAFLVSLCGARYNGIQQTTTEPHVVFTDPVTHSTMMLPVSEISVGRVWRKLTAKRAEFREAMNAK